MTSREQRVLSAIAGFMGREAPEAKPKAEAADLPLFPRLRTRPMSTTDEQAAAWAAARTHFDARKACQCVKPCPKCRQAATAMLTDVANALGFQLVRAADVPCPPTVYA